jgi:secreted Zn-dependent insulinase-like peptidase
MKVLASSGRFPVFFSLTTLIVVLLSAGCATSKQPQPPGEQQTPATGEAGIRVHKSPNDTRSYRYLVLDNGLKTLLVSDPGTDKAAASLAVLRGYYHEPAEYPGLAHFLEHMLFLGTEKYPEVDAYQQFISAHGGTSNAYTSAEHTNYFFEVQPEYFRGAMDRFAQFFISPLLDTAYVEREKNAVHSEYQLQIKDDGWRGNAVAKTAMDPHYEGAKFYIGSLDTLSEGVDKALEQFFEANYSADQMVLVALGSESLDDLEGWIRPMFGAIENRRIGPAPAPGPAFRAESLPARLTYRTLNDRYQLSYNFPIPSVDTFYRTKPAQYLTNLLGHEGEGSLHQALNERGWIESLGAGVGRLDASNSLLTVNIALTPAGRAALQDIDALLFGYIELLNGQDPEAWRYDEQASAAALSFRFQEQSSPTGFVYRTSPSLALYPPEDVLVANYLMEGFDADLIRRYLSYLTPDNVLVEFSGPDLETDAVEPWFEVPYRLETGLSGTTRTLTGGMHLPAPNPFLPDALELVSDATEPPVMAIDSSGRRIWLARDVEFRVPRANQTYTIGVTDGLANPRDVALAELHARLVTDRLNQFAYPAMLAGLSYQIGVNASGFRLAVSGYSDKQHTLLEQILTEFTGQALDADRFELYRQELIRQWRNFSNERPYTQTLAALNHLVVSTSFDPVTLATVAQTLTVADLAAWRRQRLGTVTVVGLAHGNLDDATLATVDELLAASLPLTSFELTRPAVAAVDEPLLFEVEVDHNDASMVLYVQDAEASFAARARSALTAQILQQAYFSSLRTDQQLGYVVALTNRTIRDQGAIAFIIQSPVASPAALEASTLAFMEDQLTQVRDMDQAVFEQFRAGLVSRLTERAKNLRERTTRYLADLDADVTSFDSQQQIARIVTSLSKEDVLAYMSTTIDRLSGARLLVYNMGKFSDAPTLGRNLPGPDAFKTATSGSASAPGAPSQRASSMR